MVLFQEGANSRPVWAESDCLCAGKGVGREGTDPCMSLEGGWRLSWELEDSRLCVPCVLEGREGSMEH